MGHRFCGSIKRYNTKTSKGKIVIDKKIEEKINFINKWIFEEQHETTMMEELNALIQQAKKESKEEEREIVRNMITTGIVKHIKGHCVTFKIDNQTFLLLENLQDEHMTSEDCAKWTLKCLNTAFDKLAIRESKE